MHDELLINGNQFYPTLNDTNGVIIKMRLPWYRSLPLSCVEQVDISIDGESIRREAVSIELYGSRHTLDEVLEMNDVLWFVLDAANVYAHTSKPLEEGNHKVSINLKLRVPYRDPEQDFIDFDFTQIVRCSKNLQLVGRDY